LFKFDVNYNSSDVNPLFDKVLEDIECMNSSDSNLFLVTPLSNSNKDECLAPGDDIEILLHHDPSTPMKSVASILKGFIDDPLFEENDDLFNLECDNDDIDAFLAIEVPMYIEEVYYDSEGDVLYLESLLSDDNTHNLSSEVLFDHEPQHIENESDHDTFSPKSNPLHYGFTGELIMIPPEILENSHTIIESLPTSTTLVEDSDSNREEIDIFSGPDDSTPPGGGEINVEVDDSFTFVTRTFLLYLTYPEVSPLLSSTENEDTNFDPGIST
ncbi:hypothetical protein Tco_1380635, partial [Tanacetum coccineum]